MFSYKPYVGAVILVVSIAGLMLQNTEAKETKKETKQQLSKYTDQQEVITTFKYGKYSRNVVTITKWQKQIMDKNKVPFKTQLMLRTINTAECWDENGLCISYNKEWRTVDCGFFQINQIHKEEHKQCVTQVLEGKKEVEKAKKSKDWKKVVEIRNKLYEKQMLWTWNRMKSQVSQFKLPEDREQRMYKLAKLHNGGPNREDYAKKALKSYTLLSSHYQN